MKYLRNSLILLLLTNVAVAQGTVNFNRAKMDSLLDVYEQKNKLMLTISLSENQDIFYTRATGYAFYEDDQQVKSNIETKFRIGSISKMFTSVMILQLIEQKKLKLSTPLSKFYPRFPHSKKITIEHLLKHRSGIHNFTDDPEYVTYMTQKKNQAELMEIFMKLPSDFEPGSKHSYSNTNYVLLGFIIEKLTKKDYSTVLQEAVADLIGLQNTYFGSNADISKNEARSYRFDGRKWIHDTETDLSVPHGAGGIVSVPTDMIRFIEALFYNKLLTKETVDQMIIQQDGYGMGVFNIPFYDKTGIGHNGRIDGFESVLVYFPNEKFALALSANGINANLNEFLIGVLCIYFNMPYKIPEFYSINVDENLLAEYSGNYFNTTMQLHFYVTKEENVIVGQAEGQSSFPLNAKSDKVFTYEPAHIEIEFQRDSENKVHQFILKQNGMEFMFQKIQ